jgi:hypothetical protein
MGYVYARWHPKGREDRQARVARLEQRIAAATDPKVRERLQAQLRYFRFEASGPKLPRITE